MSDDLTPEEKLARKEAALASYPIEMHFVAGPYCGCILEPRQELMYDVHRQMHPGQRSVQIESIPTNFVPVDPMRIVLSGWAGHCLYVLVEETKQWAFAGYVDLVEPESSE